MSLVRSGVISKLLTTVLLVAWAVSAYYEVQSREHPEDATSVGRHEYDDRVDRLVTSGSFAGADEDRSYMKHLEGIDSKKLSEQDRLSQELIHCSLAESPQLTLVEAELARVYPVTQVRLLAARSQSELRDITLLPGSS